MKNKLKIITLITAFSLTGSGAYAAVEINDNIYDRENNAIKVSGKISDVKPNIPLGLIITKDGEAVFADYVTAVDKNSSGEIEYLFSPYAIDTTSESATFTIDVYSDITKEHESKTFSYTGAGEKLTILKSLSNPDLVDSIITESGEKINIDVTMYNDVSNKNELIQKIASISLDLPDNCDTAEKCDMVQHAVSTFIDRYIELCCNCELAEIEDGNDYTAWAGRYYDLLEMGAKFRSYYEDAMKKGGFINRIKTLNAGSYLADVKQKIFDCVFLETVQNNSYQKIMAMVSEFPQYINLNTELSGLTAVQISKKYEAVAQKNFTDIPAFKRALQAAPTGNVSVGGSGSGSGSKSGIGNVSIANPLPSQTTSQGTKEMNFSDIENVPWAMEAIRECYKRKVISGRTDDIFAPQDYVTRAEFIKMITTALNKGVGADITFTDVSANDWFYPYVRVAYALGLIHGNENNCFMPDENITRQDMALITYNALQNTSKGDAVGFADKEQISSYAMDAVGYLYQNNLISGMGDNTFAPLNNTTRAEAASIIYRVFLK